MYFKVALPAESPADYLSRRTPKGAYSFGLASFAGYGPTVRVLRDTSPYYLLKSDTLASDHTSLVGRETQPSVGILINELVFP